MEDHTADSLVEEREELMVPPSGGNPVFRNAHFLKPMLSKDPVHLPPSPSSLLSSKPTFFKIWNFGFSKSSPSEKWKLWVKNMKPKYQEIWKISGIYHAILASTYSVPRDKMLILGLAEYWCCDTNTFIFPWGEVTITLEDVMQLGCFSVLGSSFLTSLNGQFIDVFDCLRSGVKKIKYASGGAVTPCMWMEYFMGSGMDVEHEAFLLYWLSKFVFPRSQILVQDFQVAIHLSRGNRIALAPVVLACIYRDMSVLRNSMVKSVESESRIRLTFTTWHYDLVQMWVWERFAGFRPLPNVTEMEVPRSARWNGFAKSNISNVRMAFDTAKLSFLWRPYAMISSFSMLSNMYKDNEQWVVVESDAEESYARCLRASELVGLGYIEQYLPHRVAMQFGFDQDIPPLVMKLGLGSYDRPIRGVKLYIPPRLFESDVSSRYVAWWRGVMAVNEKMVTNSNHDKELLPYNAESLATPGFLSGCVEERPENGLTTAQLMTRSGKSDSLERRNDLDNDPVMDSNDNVEEDSLTIAQLLNRSRKINNFENARFVGDELVLNTITSKFMALAICPETTKKLTCTSEPVEPSVPIMPTSNLCEESKSSPEKRSGPIEDAVVTRSFEMTNEPLEMSVHSMPSSDNGKKRKSSTERKTEVEKYAVVSSEDNIVKHSMPSSDNGKKRKPSTERQTVVSPEDNIISLEEESSEETTLEPQHLGLEARIWRLENILDMIKAAKFRPEN
ncbi:Aminotransferase-like, plant mobile domain-containing protein [Heracleum sosnowskyi]|uniref:Aminotransferase-like, plant mobile domain-containing protein n=1 Tax=Heracleum sosnowskyi TaxID=360622 RepID=A0AAD8HLC7_9APIA|nr:Aminotransferase-like, plant mobile domain-containing protein [Heracleum sosnowskyi]